MKRLLLLLAAAVAAGCGSSDGDGTRRDALASLVDAGGDAVTGDAAVPADALSGAEAGAGMDGALPSDAGLADASSSPDAGGTSDAAALPASVRLIAGRARLLGEVGSGCSHQQPASGNGHRWCAFEQPGPLLGRSELWVIDVTRAAMATVVCDGTDAACLRLSSNVWTGTPDEGPSHPSAHRFHGDTLIFHADVSSASNDLYSGPIYAWRPGWTAAKPISGPKAITCSAHARAEVAFCLENISPDSDPVVSFDLTAGRLADGPMKLVSRIYPSRPNTAIQWAAAYSRDGSYLAFSTGAANGGAEVLSVVRPENIGQPNAVQVIATGVSRWKTALDGAKVYYLQGYNYDVTGNPSGTLVRADFPSGANAVTLAAQVGSFELLFDGSDVDRGVGYFDQVADGRGRFRILREGQEPTAAVTIFEGGAAARVSPDLQHTLFARAFDEDLGLSDLWVRAHAAPNACALTTKLKADLFGPEFMPSAGLVFWADEVDEVNAVGEGWVARSADCSAKRKFADHIDYWRTQGRTLIYSTRKPGESGVDLHLAPIGADGSWPAGGATVLARSAEPAFTDVQDGSALRLLYSRLSTATVAENGLYLSSP
jgi:hypothetical protein